MDRREEEEEELYFREEGGEEEDVYPMDGADWGACWCHDSAVCPDEIEDLDEAWYDWQEGWQREG